MATRFEARVAPWKKQEVENLTELLEGQSVIALARIDKLPSKQFQDIRAAIREDATIRVTKNTLLELAMENLDGDKEGLSELEEHLSGQNALILSDANPFKLFKLIEGNKAKAPAKPGDLAPHDIKVEKGDTPFKPGPVVGDLQKAGLPAKIEAGKVVIASTKVVCEEGEEISADLASALTRLEIHPMTVGLDVKAVWEDGTVFERDDLDIDIDAFVGDLANAHARAFALATELAIPTTATLPITIGKAVSHARALALEGAVPEPEIIEQLLARGQGQAQALAGQLGDDVLAGSSEAAEDETPEPTEDEGKEAEAEGAEDDEENAEEDVPEEEAEADSDEDDSE